MSRKRDNASDGSNSVIIEMTQRGAYVKVCAIDPVTGTEAAIVGDASAPRERLEALAIKKLVYVMEKEGKR